MRAKAVYRALLYFYPAAFRHEYGDQMLYMFAEQLDDARQSGGQLTQARLWLRAALDAFIIAPQEHWHVIAQDLNYALRTMAASLRFTVFAVLSLALGIGANIAIFGLWNGVLHAPLPGVQKPEQLVMLSDPDTPGMWTGRWISRTDGPRQRLTYSEFEQLQDNASAFSALMASESNFDTWRGRYGNGEWEQVKGRVVSGEYFQVLGVTPVIGHAFTVADDQGDAPYAVLSYSYWQSRFGGRPEVLGQTLTIRTKMLTIIGVAPQGFFGETSGQQPDLWIPLRMQPSLNPGRDWLSDQGPGKTMWLNVFGRLKPGLTQAQAEAQANALFQAGLETFYGNNLSPERRRDFLDQYLRIRSAARGASDVRTQFAASLTTMLAAVGVLLLIACANLANLLLARGAARRPEMALRLSLGASHGRLIRQMMTESLTLAVLGGLAGLVAAVFLHAALVRLMGGYDPEFHMNFSLDPLVLAFALASTLASTLLFGLLPAWQATKMDAGESLKDLARNTTSSRGRMRWGRFLVSMQLALSLPLLVGAGLLTRTAYNLQRVELGYPAGHLLLVRIDSREGGYDALRRQRLFEELLGEFQRNPAIQAASFSLLGVFSGGNSALEVQVEGYAAKSDNDRGSAVDTVGPGYFSTLGVPVVLGREILESDHAGSPRVCVINEAFAQQFFQGRNPIGMHITATDEGGKTTCQVVGVAKDARTQHLRGKIEPRFYVPAMQPPSNIIYPIFLIRPATASAPALAAVRDSIQRAGTSIPIVKSATIEEQLAPLTAQDRAIAQLAAAFGAVAIALAAVGLYGVLSYGIARRRSEIAIRIALGARPRAVTAMILRETSGVILTGLALGAGLAFAASRWITSQLYGVAPQDPLTLMLSAAMLVAVAMGATYLPALQASRLDPMAALRRE